MMVEPGKERCPHSTDFPEEEHLVTDGPCHLCRSLNRPCTFTELRDILLKDHTDDAHLELLEEVYHTKRK